jgi:phosphoribosyl-ATP pyrophosphohydrolase/phosphoribosyl-AMP cyclohydrolase
MIIPSIDLMDGQAVQLIGGERRAIDAGDPMPIAEGFTLAGEIAVIDLDAALGRGDNSELVEALLRRFPCRVGGGIRDERAARRWLDAGARKVILGTAATPELLSKLPRERVIAALDARHGEVVVEGWRKGTGKTIAEQIEVLRPFVGGFLVTFVEREGRMKGIDVEQARQIVELAGDARVTAAGGVATVEEIAELDRAGADAQVGMALYSGSMRLADAIVAPARSEREDGLWATVIVDEQERALGLAWSDLESVREAVERRRGVYHSRRRGLWVKGETSGDSQELLRVDLDCDRDALRFVVRQEGRGFCHLGSWTCWGEDRGLPRLFRRLRRRLDDASEGSYTRRLLEEEGLLGAKLREEAQELSEATTKAEVTHEAADVIYFTLVSMLQKGVSLTEVEAELERRSLRLSRRRGDAKPAFTKDEGPS